jgi:hypothetical protein
MKTIQGIECHEEYKEGWVILAAWSFQGEPGSTGSPVSNGFRDGHSQERGTMSNLPDKGRNPAFVSNVTKTHWGRTLVFSYPYPVHPYSCFHCRESLDPTEGQKADKKQSVPTSHPLFCGAVMTDSQSTLLCSHKPSGTKSSKNKPSHHCVGRIYHPHHLL